MIDQVLLHRNRDHKAKTVKMEKVHQEGEVLKGTSPSGKPNQPSWYGTLIGILLNVPGTRRKKAADLETSERFFTPKLKRQARSDYFKFTQSSTNGLCITGRRMARWKVGLPNENRSILKKSGKRSPRAHLEFKCTMTAERFIKIREQLGQSLGVAVGRRWSKESSLA